MEDKKYKIADLQEKSEEWKIPFSNLLAGFVLEEFMLRFSASEFKNRFLFLRHPQRQLRRAVHVA